MALDPHDTATALIPGIPPLPIWPPRTNAEQRLKAAGYQSARTRPACANCKHVDERCHNTGSDFESQTTYCTRHRAEVKKRAICGDWNKR